MTTKAAADEGLRDFFQNQVTALKILYDNRLPLPTLMLLYATLDVAAFIKMGGDDSGAGKRFQAFANKYFLGYVPGITESDLWGARCAILHTATPQSSSSKKGKAREILYCWGRANVSSLDKVILKKGGSAKYVALSIEDLFVALGYSIDGFLRELESNRKLYKECMERAAKIYVHVPVQKNK